MSTLVVVGAQWGDEGKGKVVDALAAEADVVARFAGGNNAGHTLVVDGRTLVTHLVPSGCLYAGTRCVLGAGMVIDPAVLEHEIATLRGLGLLAKDELRVSLDAHVVLPCHRELDGLREEHARQRGRAIGTTKRGIGPAYEAKAARRGLRVRDLFEPTTLDERLEQNEVAAAHEAERLGGKLESTASEWRVLALEWARWLQPLACDVGALCHDAIVAGQRVLFEGAQGALLDVDHGTYPYVTSSSTIAGGVCTGIGIGPTAIDGVWGISKAYATRVGAGPFPTKLADATGDRLRELGAEFGATTGRPRDCGWLDLPALRHAARLSGMTGLAITKLDVLAALRTVSVCVAYEGGLEPGTHGLFAARPKLESCPGWDDPDVLPRLRTARTLDALPAVARAYLDRIAEATGVPIALVSVGASREETIAVARPFA
jgi:adenylosuccinate synthase